MSYILTKKGIIIHHDIPISWHIQLEPVFYVIAQSKPHKTRQAKFDISKRKPDEGPSLERSNFCSYRLGDVVQKTFSVQGFEQLWGTHAAASQNVSSWNMFVLKIIQK